MEHGTDGGSDVDDVYVLRIGSVLDVPAEEHQWDVRVVGVPLAMGGADVVVFEFPREHVGTRQAIEVAGAQTVVAVDDALADELWHTGRGGMLAVDDAQQVGALLCLGDGFCLGGMSRMAFLPEELGGTEEKPGTHLPPYHVGPLVYQDRKIPVGTDPVLVCVPDDGF